MRQALALLQVEVFKALAAEDRPFAGVACGLSRQSRDKDTIPSDELRFALEPGVQFVRFTLGEEASFRYVDEFVFYPADQCPTGFNAFVPFPVVVTLAGIRIDPSATSYTPSNLFPPSTHWVGYSKCAAAESASGR